MFDRLDKRHLRDLLKILKAFLKGFVKALERAFKTGFEIRIACWISREPQKSLKEGQEDQGTLKQLGVIPPSFFTSTWSSWPSCWLFLGTLAIHQAHLEACLKGLSKIF